MENLRRKIGREVFDYLALQDALSDYRNPRAKITDLLKKGIIIRVKKGLYIFGPGQRMEMYSKEYIGNLIYGPSYISLDYALSYHNLIPEKVSVITSVTTKRPRNFFTPVGQFQYRHLNNSCFSIGFQRIEKEKTAFLMASPEKALLDKIKDDRKAEILNRGDAKKYLFEDLRIDPDRFYNLDIQLSEKIAISFSSKKVNLCVNILKKER